MRIRKDQVRPSTQQKIPLSLVLTIPFIVQVVGIVGLVGFLSYRSGQQALEDLANQLLRQTSERVIDCLNKYLQPSQQIVAVNRLMVEQGTLNPKNQEQLRQQLWQQMLLNPSIPSNGFFGEDGSSISYNRIDSKETQELVQKITGKSVPLGTIFYNEIRPYQRQYYTIDSQGKPRQLVYQFKDDFRTTNWYKQAQAAGKQSWTSLSFARVIPALQTIAVSPVYESPEKISAFFVVGYFLSHISAFLHELKFSPAGQIFIIEPSGELVATSVLAEQAVRQKVDGTLERLSAFNSQDTVTREISRQLFQRLGQMNTVTTTQQLRLTVATRAYFIQVMPYRDPFGMDWRVVTVIPESDFLAKIQANSYQTALLCVVALLGAVGSSIWTSRRITRSFRLLAHAIKGFAEDRQYHPLPSTRISELAGLIQSFDQMMKVVRGADDLRRNYAHDLERQVAEKTIALTEAQRIARVGSWEFDVLTGESRWSAEQFRILGFDPALPLPPFPAIFDLVPLADQPRIRAAVEAAIAHQAAYVVEHGIIRPDGSIGYVISSGEAICNDQRKVVKLMGTITDISQRKQAELARHESESHQRALIQAIPDLLMRMNRDGIYLEFIANSNFHIVGNPEDLVGTHVADTLPSQPAQQRLEAIHAALETQTIQIYEHTLALASHYLIEEVRVVPYAPDETLVLVRNITDRKRAEIALQTLNTELEGQVQDRTAQLQQALNFEALLKRITDRVRDSLDEHQILQTAVDALAYGLPIEACNSGIYNAEQTITTIAYELTHTLPPKKGIILAITPDPSGIFAALIKGNVCHFCEITLNPFRPEQQFLTLLAVPIVDDQGVLGDLWLYKPPQTVFDDPEIRLVQQVANQCAIALRQSRLYQAAQAQVQELERLSQLKDDFLSTVSHELRTPMSNIKMATQMLEINLKRLGVLTDPNEPIHRYFSILKDEGNREINLINDLLDLARLDAKPEPLSLSKVELQSYIPGLVDRFRDRASKQGQFLSIRIPDQFPSLVTDLMALERLLSELLNNACKYTPAGETITVSTQIFATVLEIWISNSGVAISASECERIFDKFYRIPNNDPWKHGGTGLGLALVKRLTERLGGRIRVVSEAKVTSFILEFDLGEDPSELLSASD